MYKVASVNSKGKLQVFNINELSKKINIVYGINLFFLSLRGFLQEQWKSKWFDTWNENFFGKLFLNLSKKNFNRNNIISLVEGIHLLMLFCCQIIIYFPDEEIHLHSLQSC